MTTHAGQVAIVTGGGRGIGRGVAVALASAGADVVAAARTKTDLDDTVTAAPDTGSITGHACDVTSTSAVGELVEAAVARHGRIDILVACHGIYQGGVGALELELEQFDRTFAVNVRGSLSAAQSAGRAMREGGRGGRIVFISSMNAEASQTGAVDYDASKAALHGLTRALALELAPEAITVNCIAPGWIRTPMSEEELEHLEGEGRVMNPLHAVGEPQDIALAALWLSDPRNGFTTGTVVRVDGGQTAMLPLPWPADQPPLL